MTDIEKLIQEIIRFRNARDWAQFHKPKDVAISLIMEAAELLEHFQWKTEEEVKKHLINNKKGVAHEIADVMTYAFILCHDLNIDPVQAIQEKLIISGQKHPVHKIKGRHP